MSFDHDTAADVRANCAQMNIISVDHDMSQLSHNISRAMYGYQMADHRMQWIYYLLIISFALQKMTNK